MKRMTIKQVLLGLVCLMFVGVATATSVDSESPVEAGASFAIAAGLAATAFTEKEIADAKAKYGPVKLLTVVVEEGVRDIDRLTFNQLVILKGLDIDTMLLRNKAMDIEQRICELEKAKERAIVDGKLVKKECEFVLQLTGEYVEKGEKYEFLIKRPDRNDIKILTHLGKAENVEEFMDYAQKNLIVGGDTSSLDDGLVYTGFVSQVRSMIQPATSFLQKV